MIMHTGLRSELPIVQVLERDRRGLWAAGRYTMRNLDAAKKYGHELMLEGYAVVIHDNLDILYCAGLTLQEARKYAGSVNRLQPAPGMRRL